jgi:FSR family fosmidomycin resistance protein-like MFS transporter
MSFITDPFFLAVAISHFTVDFINSFRGIVLAFLSEPLGLSNSMIAAITTVYVMLGSLMQPIFGYFSDRIGTRWVLAVGVLWMAVFLSLAIFVPGWPSIIFLVIGALGSSAVHPAGAAQATMIGRTRLAGQETTAASLFSLMGNLGYFVGPVIGGILLQSHGMRGLAVIAVLALPVAGWAFKLKNYVPTSKANQITTRKMEKPGFWIFIVLILLAAFQSWAQQNLTAFLPKYLSDSGWMPTKYGFVTALFSGGSALGIVLGGRLADKFGKWRVILLGMVTGFIPLILIPTAGLTGWLFVLVFLAGFFTGMPFSCIVVLSQHLFPVGMGLASGLTMGFLFASGALGTLLSGYIADLYGFTPVFYLSAALALLSGLLGLFFRSDHSDN